MSTANFSRPELSRVYSIGMEIQEQDECIAQVLFDDELSSVKEALLKLDFIQPDEGYLDRYTSKIGRIDLQIFNHDYKEWENTEIFITLENGYYEGAMIDINKDELEGYKLTQTMKNKIVSYIKRIEKVLEKHTLPLVRVATFSNGEAIYERASNKKSVLKSIANGYAQWPGQIGNC